MYIGVDPSTNDIACVAISDDVTLVRSYPLHGRDITTRIAGAFHVPQRFVQYVYDQTGELPKLVVLEAPVAMRGRQTIIKLAQISGALIAGFDNVMGTPPLLVQSGSWKKEVVGKGNANKQQVEEWVRDEWPEFHRRSAGDQDTLDAACIARYAALVDRRVGHVGIPELEV